MIKRTVVILAVAVAIAGCVSMEMVTRTEDPAVPAVNELESIGVTKPRIAAGGLLDVAMRIGEQRYWAQRNEPSIGDYGSFAGVGSISNVSEDGTPLRTPQRIDPIDIHVEFVLLDPRRGQEQLEQVVEEYDGDAFIAGTLNLNVGVIEVFTAEDRWFQDGYFYLQSDSWFEWEMYDAETGESLFISDDSGVEYPSLEMMGTFRELPVRPGDQDGLDEFLRSAELDDYIRQAIDEALVFNLYEIAPYSHESLQPVEE
ncbi:MAG: hypothetical protein ACOCZB_03030 [Spirochaetota bacterium]